MQMSMREQAKSSQAAKLARMTSTSSIAKAAEDYATNDSGQVYETQKVPTRNMGGAVGDGYAAGGGARRLDRQPRVNVLAGAQPMVSRPGPMTGGAEPRPMPMPARPPMMTPGTPVPGGGGMAPMLPGGAEGIGMGMGANPMLRPQGFKRGGRVKTAACGGAMKRAAGGAVVDKAGAGSGVGRLENAAAQKRAD